jgi:hypothetical protein
MAAFISLMIVFLSLATMAMLIGAAVLASHGLVAYRHAMSIRDRVMPEVNGMRAASEGLSQHARSSLSRLKNMWALLRPKVDRMEHEVACTRKAWSRSRRTAVSVGRKLLSDVGIVRAAVEK